MDALFRLHWAKLCGGKNPTTVETRKDSVLLDRRTKRQTELWTRRNIPSVISPYNSPAPTRKVKVQKVQPKMNSPAPQPAATKPSAMKGYSDKRLEMLAAWKKNKEKQKQEQKAKAKPIFKVYHIEREARVNLDNVNKTIKGKLITPAKKMQFAPKNHQFVPPKGLKLFNFNKDLNKFTTSTCNIQKPTTASTPKRPLGKVTRMPAKATTSATQAAQAQIKFTASTCNVQKPTTSSTPKRSLGKVTRTPAKATTSDTQAAQAQVKKNKPKALIKPVAVPSKRRDSPRKYIKNPDNMRMKVQNMGARPKANNMENKLPEEQKSTKTKNKGRGKNTTTPNRKTDEPKSANALNNGWEQVTVSTEDTQISNRVQSTPSPSKEVVYISPFVTQARGKDRAREEFKIRQSIANRNQSLDVEPELVGYLTAYTSPKNGADYFLRKLNSEIDRIKGIYQKWEEHLEDPDLPEEATSSINVAVGQSKLLIAEKFKQFRNLIVQCKTQTFEGKPITCEDLHGFWDMIYMQVENLDKRFANLERLRENNWLEMMSEPKVEQPIAERTRNKRKNNGRQKKAASSRLRDMIRAARERQMNKNLDGGGTGEARIVTPLKEQISQNSTTPNRKSLRVSVLTSETAKRCSSSPGLTMMKVTQSIKQGNGLTPARSILKPDGYKSTGKKSVIFRESSSPSFDNVLKSTGKQSKSARKTLCFSGDDEKENTPRTCRRSLRLSLK